MLTAEEAAARLATLKDANWREAAARRVAALPRALRGPAEDLLPPDPPYTVDRRAAEAHRNRSLAAAKTLDELTDPGRTAVLTALHPGLGAGLARWWVDGQRRPYLRGWARKAFRVSNAPQVSRTARLDELTRLLRLLGPYDADPVWLAIWSGYLGTVDRSWAFSGKVVGDLLASVIDLGGETAAETFGTLIDVANGEHPTGIMGRHVIVALLGSARPEGWAFVERLLLAAQRQEGLRQSILEAIDEAHPDAFDRMIAVVLDQKLLRFAAAVRAAGVWLGLEANVTKIPLVEDRVRKLAAFRANEVDRLAALAADDPGDAYLALCAGGMRDALAALGQARTLATVPAPDIRAVAVRFAAASGLSTGQEVVAMAVDDPDIGVASLAAKLLQGSGLRLPGTFDALARLTSRLPAADKEVSGLGVERFPVTVSRAATAGRLVDARGDRPIADLLPWLPVMNTNGRAAVARLIAATAGLELRGSHWTARQTAQLLANTSGQAVTNRPQLPAEFRPVIIGLLTDRSSDVRSIAIAALTATSLDPAEAPAIEALLTRTATDVRRGALTLLASLPTGDARMSAARLAASKDKRQRDAATELLREIAARQPLAGSSAAVPAADSQPGGTLVPIEDLRVTLTAGRTLPVAPRKPPHGPRPDKRAARILLELDEIAARHRDVLVTTANWQGTREMLFGDIEYFPSPFTERWMAGPGQRADGAAQQAHRGLADGLVLGEVFHDWWAGRPAALRGADDARDALHCFVLASLASAGTTSGLANARASKPDWWRSLQFRSAGEPPDRLGQLAAVRAVTGWLVLEYPNGPVIDECLDALETTLAAVPEKILVAVPERDPQVIQPLGQPPHTDWRHNVRADPWYRVLAVLLRDKPELFTKSRLARWYGLMRWLEQPAPQADPWPASDDLLVAAHTAGVASDGDVAAAFLHLGNRLFPDLTRHWRAKHEARYPSLVRIADRVRDRVVEVELRRGDLPTPTSSIAGRLGSVAGVSTVAALLGNLGETPLARSISWRSDPGGRGVVLSHLLRVSFPRPHETGQDLKVAAAAAMIPDARLVDLAIYAPQWATPVEDALGWPGLADGVLWLHAHTKDRMWSVDAELRDSWAALSAERTPLSADDLMDGAVDVLWFMRAYQALGEQRWAILREAAKHASNGTGHRRAQLFADAMLGKLTPGELRARITGKGDQDAVRALGLLPLPADTAGRVTATAGRYAILREFERRSKAFGAQRQARERTAVRIGVQNLARTAGYPDPLRFTWAVEAQQAGDLSDGPVTVTTADVTVTLSVAEDGVPALAVAKKGKPLKTVPAALKKDPGVAALTERKTELAKQATRVRASLEAAMIARDAFTEQDFTELRRHPVVMPMLSKLVWVTEEGSTCLLPGGIGVSGIDAGLASLAALGPLRIAHPVDLVADDSWVSWQERFFTLGWRQPFKQVFRELYVRTAQEARDSPLSHRYDGHQLQPRQALALLTARTWVSSLETGGAARVFHRDGLVARVTFADGIFTPAEAEPPTIDGVYFTKRGEYLAQSLDAVPPVVFSEAMRDLDLVVSVAHAGGVDPEATASTTEMRAALVRETARLLNLANIEFVGRHVVITGRLGEYSVHLGSGTVHRRPGGALCIIPVGSQHRGRLFLPFADDDPKTAEVVAKILLLARDYEIKDPTILEQLRS